MLEKKHWERGSEGMHYCWVNSTRTNSFNTVGRRESSSWSTEEYSSQRIVCLSALLILNLSTKKVFQKRLLHRGLAAPAPSPPKKTPAAKFASQRDAHMRTDAQIKFLYYPLGGSQNISSLSNFCKIWEALLMLTWLIFKITYKKVILIFLIQ